jgi:hypothetical protein
LGIESTKGRFDSLADPDNSFFYARAQQRNPQAAAKEHSRPARRRRAARVRSTVKFHSFHGRHCRIEDIRPIRSELVVLLHLTLRTRNSSCVDVSFMEIKRAPAFGHDHEIDSPRNEQPRALIIRFSPITGSTVHLIAAAARPDHGPSRC